MITGSNSKCPIIETVSCLKTWLKYRAIWDSFEGGLEIVVMVKFLLEAWHSLAGSLDIARLPLGVVFTFCNN